MGGVRAPGAAPADGRRAPAPFDARAEPVVPSARMEEGAAPQHTAKVGCLGRVGLCVAILGGAGLFYYLGRRSAPEPPTQVVRAVEERVADTATVLLAVRNLAKLETVAYHMERVIDLKQRQPRMFGLIGAEDWILLIAVGDAVAGIDLGKMREEDIQLDATTHSVRLRLPPPELLWVKLDNERTYVHTRRTDMMAERNEAIETRARQLGEESIRKAALDSEILQRAEQGAEQTLTTLLRAMSFERVEIVRSER